VVVEPQAVAKLMLGDVAKELYKAGFGFHDAPSSASPQRVAEVRPTPHQPCEQSQRAAAATAEREGVGEGERRRSRRSGRGAHHRRCSCCVVESCTTHERRGGGDALGVGAVGAR
jgi:hypothetical protein